MNMSKLLLYLLNFISLLLILGPLHVLNASDAKSVSIISVDQVKQLMNKPDTVIIDVRKPKNWWRSSKKIFSAVREDPSKVDQWAVKYTQNQILIFY